MEVVRFFLHRTPLEDESELKSSKAKLERRKPWSKSPAWNNPTLKTSKRKR